MAVTAGGVLLGVVLAIGVAVAVAIVVGVAVAVAVGVGVWVLVAAVVGRSVGVAGSGGLPQPTAQLTAASKSRQPAVVKLGPVAL